MRKPKEQKPLNDLSHSLIPLETSQDRSARYPDLETRPSRLGRDSDVRGGGCQST